jgi:23S rRNA pseudouridine2457 synthase
MARYYAFYKPYGVLTTFTDPQSRSTLKEYIQIQGIYAAGRLDMDSEGLLLLTDDGPLINCLTDPKYNHQKTYLVQVEGMITCEAVEKLVTGVVIKGEKTRPCIVEIISPPELPPRGRPITPHAPTSWIKMILSEGKNRQIRHMTAAVGFPTLRLVREAVGPIHLGDLHPGGVRELTSGEVRQLKKIKLRSSHA